MKKELGIYIHIPFCTSRCPYCDFYSNAGCREDEISRYAAAVAAQLVQWSRMCGEYAVDTVYFGGGTPTLLSLRDFGLLMDALGGHYDIEPGAEISCECNTADAEYLRGLRSLGVNRLSIGAQSLDDDELRELGRVHNSADFVRTYNDAREAGFDNISADLMLGIPCQSRESLHMTLERLCALKPEHVSAYCLRIEESTPFGKAVGRLPLPPEDDIAEMYLGTIKFLAGQEIEQYEISNFARAGYECRHNLKYWNCDEYLGFGASAHSFFGSERFSCPRSLERYLGGEYIAGRTKPSPADLETEYVMLAMRRTAGLVADEYVGRFGVDPHEKYRGRFSEFVRRGLVTADMSGYRFTPRGMLVSNTVLSSILDL
ncbi:MAG TPA: radical SAM family heme chaperone HemW [Clostridiales bacterium]|jgi:oxygen-independent coproporphyrinogen-3 oxidase|nr:radical SAM family heme chaperone HemW [Clostridiales bacterium]